jgi:hypothetical protein
MALLPAGLIAERRPIHELILCLFDEKG